MRLTKLQLTNFRNLSNHVYSFSKGINCIFGDNGNGKTNLLEGIYYLIKRRSFRKNTSFPQLLGIDCEQPEIIFSSFLQGDEDIAFSGKLSSEGAHWYYNNSPSKKKLALTPIFINPFDSFSFHTTPAFRRDWIDSRISDLDRNYKRSLSHYQQALRFKNSLLAKQPTDFKTQVLVINEQLADLSVELTFKRNLFLKQMSEFLENIFKDIFHESHILELKLESKSSGMSRDEMLHDMRESMDKDILARKVRKGIHRDDYIFFFDGFNSYEYCSLGQQKMSFLSLIFAYIELFRYKLEEFPIVLIDDVSGELDSARWTNLIEYLEKKEFQVFITTANKNFKEELEKIKSSNQFVLRNGDVQNS